MKNHIQAVTLAVILATMTVVPAQAQTWTDASGTPLPMWSSITAAGPIDISVFGWLGRRTCDISMVGYVSGYGEISLVDQSAGFEPNCSLEDVGEFETPLVLTAGYDPFTSTGKIATFNSFTYQSPVAPCHFINMKLNWYDASVSEARLPNNLTGGLCTFHAGSKLRITAGTLGGVSIN